MTEMDIEIQTLRRLCADLEAAHRQALETIAEKDRTIVLLMDELKQAKAKRLEVETENRLQHGQIVRLRRQMELMEVGIG